MKFIKLLFLFFITCSLAQNKKSDSLEIVLKNNSSHDTIRVNTINKLAVEIFNNNKDQAKILLEEAIKIADSLNYINGKNESLYLLGKTLTNFLDLEEAENTINKAITEFKSVKNQLGVVKSFNQLGVIYFNKSDNEKALEYFYKALDLNDKIKNDILYAILYNNIGLICGNQNKQDQALLFYYKSLAIHRKFNNQKNIAICLNNIGTIYNNKKENVNALKAFSECLAISKQNNDYYLMAFSYHNMGMLFEDQKEYKKALNCFFKALKIQKEIKSYSGIAYAYNGISSVCIILRKYDEALKYISINQKITKKYKLLKHQLDINEMLTKIYKTKKKYKKALEYQILYKTLYDSINNIAATNKFVDLEKKYKYKEKELKSKEHEIQLNKQIEQSNKQLNNTKRQFLYGLIFILFLFVLLGFIVYNSRIKRLSSEYQKVVLKQKLLRSQIKPHFIFNSLSVLQGIVLHKEYNKASLYISKFSRLLREILETSNEEIISLDAEIKIIEHYIFLRKISDQYSNCTYTINIDKNLNKSITFIPPMIVQPLVENSFEHGFIELNKKYHLEINFNFFENKLICTIIDNGEGLYSNKELSYFDKKKSISSSIIKERLELFSKKYRQQFDFKLVDRTIKGDKGTKVIIMLPYKIGKNG